MKLYKCETCGSILWRIEEGANPVCCENNMKVLEPNVVDASHEKHVPVVKKVDGKFVIEIGSVEHPMVDAHYIMWIAAVGENRVMKRDFKPGEKPSLTVCDKGFNEFYAYCNIHGLWKGEAN